ncbi:MAG: TlpA family protein disulfide reductase [Egibacteraceae bacterium]
MSAEPTRRRKPPTLLLTVGGALALVVLAIVVLALTLGGEPSQAEGAGNTGSAASETATGSTLADRAAPGDVGPLPDFALPAFDGDGKVRAADYRGRPLVVNFWATWCAPCVEEMPALQSAADELGDEVAFLGVNTNDAHDQAVALAERLGITYDLARDDQGAYAEEAGLFGMPTTLFVDASGTVRFRQTGGLEQTDITRLVREHLSP